MNTLLLIQLLVSFFLCGLIWLVQLVHYPSFRYVAKAEFTEFENFHTRNITFIVLPAMIIELLTAIMLFANYPENNVLLLNLLTIIMIWLVTFLFSVPCHNRLLKLKDGQSIEKLIRTNWLRTLLWTAKTSLLSLYIFSVI